MVQGRGREHELNHSERGSCGLEKKLAVRPKPNRGPANLNDTQNQKHVYVFMFISSSSRNLFSSSSSRSRNSKLQQRHSPLINLVYRVILVLPCLESSHRLTLLLSGAIVNHRSRDLLSSFVG